MLAVFAAPLIGVIGQSFIDAKGHASFGAYAAMFASSLFYRVAWSTISIALSSTAVALLLAYPLAYFLSQCTARTRALLLVFVLVPFWTSILVKSFAFTVLLGRSGILNSFVTWLGFPPVPLLFNRFGVIVGMTHFLIPFMMFPILSSLLSRPPELVKAAQIMGASRWRIFRSVILPLSLPGVSAGTLLVLVLSLGFFVVPALLGGRQDMMLANLIDFYTRETLNWQMASGISVILMLFAILATLGLSRVPGGSRLLGGHEA
jgi:putative spermidine/putrescine transport system permease protein/mannopine transport system permease protein